MFSYDQYRQSAVVKLIGVVAKYLTGMRGCLELASSRAQQQQLRRDDKASWIQVYCEESYIRHEDFFRPSPSSSVTLVLPPLKSETGWTGELWSNRILLILEN